MIAAAMLIAAALATWSAAPLAGANSADADTRIDLNVLQSIALAPGLTKGDRSLNLDDLSLPGDMATTTSSGWKVSSNWWGGYDVKLRASTSPALRGKNAIDGKGSTDSFRDYTTSGCPCPWDVSSFPKGVFGYSAAVTATDGTAGDISKWGTSTSRKWRGLSTSDYRLFSTNGEGEFSMTMHFRSAIPADAVQSAGSYRANVVMSIHPSL